MVRREVLKKGLEGKSGRRGRGGKILIIVLMENFNNNNTIILLFFEKTILEIKGKMLVVPLNVVILKIVVVGQY